MKPGTQRIGLEACSTTPFRSGSVLQLRADSADADGIDPCFVTHLFNREQGMNTLASDVPE